MLMKTFKLICSTFLICFAFSACEKDNNIINYQDVIVSLNEYNTAPNDLLTINSVEIKENSLIINFSASGCSGDTWEIKLIDSGYIMESNPPQRNLRLSLKNVELCQAYITKELSFNIRDLQVDGNKVYLNITNSGDQILYEY